MTDYRDTRKGVLDFGTPVKVYLDRRFFGEEVYLGRGVVSGRTVYGPDIPTDYHILFKGNSEQVAIHTACKKPGVRCFRIRVLKKKRGAHGRPS